MKTIKLFIATLLIANSIYAQKTFEPIKDNFQSPFGKNNKAREAKSNTGYTAPQTGIKIETVKGSFSFDVSKYNLTQQQIEDDLCSYLSLNNKHKFVKVSQREDDLGFTHINYQQQFNNIPVDGALVMLHLKKGKPNSINGQIAAIENLPTIATINAEQALQIAKDYAKAKALLNTYPIQLLIAQIPTENGFTPRLAYKVRIDASFSKMENVFVDAITGKVVNVISLINDADVTATANTLYSGTQTITTDSYAGGYRLRDNARKIETYDMHNGTNYSLAKDFTNTTTNWTNQEVMLNYVYVLAVNNNWEDLFGEKISNGGAPDIYIEITDASNNVIWTKANAYYENTFPVIIINTQGLVLTNSTYTLKVYDYDVTSSDDLLGSFSFMPTSGTTNLSANGTSVRLIASSRNNSALDVHWAMEKTYDYYLNKHSRNSFDNLGSTIKNYVHKDIGWNNANWNTTVMSYGDGDGITFKPLMSLDVVGHEFTHAVVQYNGTGGLNYQGESGALNESFADIFGTCIEFYAKPTIANWTCGEDIMVSAANLRSLSNPNNPTGQSQQPDTYNGTYWASSTSTQDNGGVHTNSGVQNFWFYLLCQGGSGSNDIGNSYTVTGIGIAKAQKIVYRNLTNYLTQTATYYQSYLGSLQAAQDLYGNPSAEYSAVKAAWYAVGIGTSPTSYCSGLTKLTASSGTITDGSGNAKYDNNSNCKWRIAPPGADSIKINFTSFRTENNYDTVFIYNGPDTTFPSTWWTGNFSANLPKYTSTVGAVTIRFVSDNSNTDSGWAFNYTTYGKTPTCGGSTILSTPTGSFSDGSGASNYGNNQLCYWLIAPPCATSVTLNFSQFATESGYDGVIVYNGNNTSAPVLLNTSGTNIPNSVTSTGGEMLVLFVSDYSYNLQGFSANYTSTGSSYCSGTTILNSSDYGVISDGSGANKYCNNSNCSWLIQPPQATSVSLRFTKFNVEAASTDGQSIYDAVEVYDGTSTSGTLLGRFTGNTIPPVLTANSGSMFVKFFSDVAVNDSGWTAVYTSISPSYCNANNIYTTATGTITDGSGANSYANNSNCTWLIQPTGAKNITLNFTSFTTELNYDGVIVYDGKNDSATVLGQYTGTTIPSPITSTGGSMFVKFLSDEAVRSDGWSANYTSNLYPSIAGNIITPIKKVVQSAKVKLTGSSIDSLTTTSLGKYNFDYVKGVNYTLRPTKNNDIVKANGVNSVDVLLVQRHILNTSKLNSPYKIIAADVDGNKLVNSVDVLRMKRLILGTDTTFTKTVGTVKTDRLWEFVDSAYIFPDTTNPFPFKDSISFTNLTSNKTNQTFIGVKLGDVNYDWNPAVARGVAANSLELIVNSEKTTNNNLQLVFTSSNFNNIAALQTTLHFDNTKYDFIGIENGKLQLDYNASKANTTGHIALLWTDKNAEVKSFDKDEVLFTIVLKPRSLGIGNLELVVSNDMVETEAWDNNFAKRNIILTQRVVNDKHQTPNNLLLYPNPAHTIVGVKLDKLAGIATLIVTDVYGKQVLKKAIHQSTTTIDIAGLAKGVYMISVITEQGKQTEKLVVE